MVPGLLPIFLHGCMRDKIWEWPGDEAIERIRNSICKNSTFSTFTPTPTTFLINQTLAVNLKLHSAITYSKTS